MGNMEEITLGTIPEHHNHGKEQEIFYLAENPVLWSAGLMCQA